MTLGFVLRLASVVALVAALVVMFAARRRPYSNRERVVLAVFYVTVAVSAWVNENRLALLIAGIGLGVQAIDAKAHRPLRNGDTVTLEGNGPWPTEYRITGTSRTRTATGRHVANLSLYAPPKENPDDHS